MPHTSEVIRNAPIAHTVEIPESDRAYFEDLLKKRVVIIEEGEGEKEVFFKHHGADSPMRARVMLDKGFLHNEEDEFAREAMPTFLAWAREKSGWKKQQEA